MILCYSKDTKINVGRIKLISLSVCTTERVIPNMAKKADLLAEAKKLGLEVTEKNTIAEIEAAIAGATPAETPVEKTEAETAEATSVEETKEDAPLAKAGKRSAKAIA